MQFVEFGPGNAALDAAAQQTLAAITRALVVRPQLRIELPIGIAAAADRPAIVEQHYAQELAQVGAAGTASDAGAPAADIKAEQLKFLQQALLGGGHVDPERVFLVANGKVTVQDNAVRLELSLR
jgi:hypothetical protein